MGSYGINLGSLKVKDDSHNFTIRFDDQYGARLKIKPVDQQLEINHGFVVKTGERISLSEMRDAVRITTDLADKEEGGTLTYQVLSGDKLRAMNDDGLTAGNQPGSIKVGVMLESLDVNGDGTDEYNQYPQFGFSHNLYFDVFVTDKSITGISVEEGEINKVCGDPDFVIKAVAETPGENGTLTYKSGNERVLRIDGETGLAQITGAGKTMVTIAYASDATVGQQYVNVIVAKKGSPSAPQGLTAADATSIDGRGRIIGTTRDMEYAPVLRDGYGIFNQCGDGETYLYPDTWAVRYTETDYAEAGEAVILTIGSHDMSDQTGFVTGKDNYKGTRTISVISVDKGSQKSIAVDAKIMSRTYDGLEQYIDIANPWNSDSSSEVLVYEKGDKEKTPLAEGDDYLVFYPSDMTNAGTKKNTFVGIGKYAGTIIILTRVLIMS